MAGGALIQQPAGNGQAAPQQLSPQARMGNFFNQTTRNRTRLSDMSFSNPGDNKQVDLSAVGFASFLRIQIFGTITTGTSAAGTWDANLWPWCLIKRLQLVHNSGYTLYDTDGFSNRLVQGVMRLGWEPGLLTSPLNAPPYSTTGAKVGVGPIFPSGAVQSSTASKIGITFLIPITAHQDLRAGLLPLQSSQTRVTLKIALGNFTDWAGSSGLIGSGGTVSLTAITTMEFFSIPTDPNAMPDISFIHRIAQDSVQWTSSGDQDYRVPVNGAELRLWARFINAGVPAAMFSSASDPTATNFGNAQIIYSASQVPENYDYRNMLAQFREDYLHDLPDGVFMWDFASGGGSIEMGLSARDIYNTRRLTEFKTRMNTSIAPSANSTIEYIRQELQPRAAVGI